VVGEGGGRALTSRWLLKWMNSSSDRPNIYTSTCVNGLFPLVQYRSWVSAFGQILSNEDEAILDCIIRLYFWPAAYIYIHWYSKLSITPLRVSTRWNWDSPTSSLASECAPPPGTKGGGAHLPACEGFGESQFRRQEKKSLALCLLCAIAQTKNLSS